MGTNASWDPPVSNNFDFEVCEGTPLLHTGLCWHIHPYWTTGVQVTAVFRNFRTWTQTYSETDEDNGLTSKLQTACGQKDEKARSWQGILSKASSPSSSSSSSRSPVLMSY